MIFYDLAPTALGRRAGTTPPPVVGKSAAARVPPWPPIAAAEGADIGAADLRTLGRDPAPGRGTLISEIKYLKFSRTHLVRALRPLLSAAPLNSGKVVTD